MIQKAQRVSSLDEARVLKPGPERAWDSIPYGDSPFDEQAARAEERARIAVGVARRMNIEARWSRDHGQKEWRIHPPHYVTVGARYQTFAKVLHESDLQNLDAHVQQMMFEWDRELQAINSLGDSCRGESTRRFKAWNEGREALLREGGATGPEQATEVPDGPRCSGCGFALVSGPSRTLPPGARCQRCS